MKRYFILCKNLIRELQTYLVGRRTLVNINPNEKDGYFDQLLEM